MTFHLHTRVLRRNLAAEFSDPRAMRSDEVHHLSVRHRVRKRGQQNAAQSILLREYHVSRTA